MHVEGCKKLFIQKIFENFTLLERSKGNDKRKLEFYEWKFA